MSTDKPLTRESLVAIETAGGLITPSRYCSLLDERDALHIDRASLMAQAAKDSETIRQLREELKDAQELAREHYQKAEAAYARGLDAGAEDSRAELAKVTAEVEAAAEAAEKALEGFRARVAQLTEALAAAKANLVEAAANPRGFETQTIWSWLHPIDAAIAADDVGVAKWLEAHDAEVETQLLLCMANTKPPTTVEAHGVNVPVPDGWLVGTAKENRSIHLALLQLAASRERLHEALEELIYKPPDVSKDRDGLAARIKAALEMAPADALASHDAQLEAPLRERIRELEAALRQCLEPLPYDPDTAQWSEPGDDERREKFNAEWTRRDALLRAALSPAKPVAPAGGCLVQCPECNRIGPFHHQEGPIGFCAQCSLGEGRQVRLVVVPGSAT